MEIAIVAGEVSGDIQAGRLVEEIKKQVPSCDIWGIGGEKMRSAGARLTNDITELAVVGFWEVLKNYGRIRKVFYNILGEIRERRPKAVILVDYPGFNLRLAKKIKRRIGIPVFYYISPQVWAWGKGRIKEIKKYVDKMIVIFPFEKDFYEKEGIKAEFVGHPILNVISDRKSIPGALRRELDIAGDEKLIGLLPGSRTQEIKRHLPVFLSASKLIEDAEFVIGAASPAVAELIKEILVQHHSSIRVLTGRAYDIMAGSDLIFTSSGTATLETACFGTPMIVVYKLNWLTYFFIKFMADIKYIAMANIIAGEKVVPEFVQNEANPGNIAKEAKQILENPVDIRKKLETVKLKLGEKGAAERAAKIICKAILD